MNVLPLGKGFAQCGHIGHVCGQPQLDLAIVGRQQHIAGVGNKGFADLAADFGTHRYVLQVGVVRTEPSGLRPDQRIAGVDSASAWLDRRLQGIGISRFQL